MNDKQPPRSPAERIRTLAQAAFNADQTVDQVDHVLDDLEESLEGLNKAVGGLEGSLEYFDKTLTSLNATLTRMEGIVDRVERMVNGIVRQLESTGENEIQAEQIGHLVMEGLRALDDVAYVRFASVYRNFREARDFEAVLGELSRSPESETKGDG